jgi:hypothetical protein
MDHLWRIRFKVDGFCQGNVDLLDDTRTTDLAQDPVENHFLSCPWIGHLLEVQGGLRLFQLRMLN